ncbi:hypothetical protein GF420_06805 [candidate division GN15 bacterium]|nr:hypothetical protein [candidate division GN15 bacterium]
MAELAPTITIVHEITGRVRYRLSHPLDDASAVEARVRGHEGIDAIEYTDLTRSVLVRFDPRAVTSKELTVRLGVAFSMDQELTPVRVFAGREREDLSSVAVLAGLSLLAALAWRMRSRTGLPALEYGGGLLTAAATLEHGYQEIQERGEFDPEVLSIVYLITSFFRGNLLPASIVTWLATFGRHLIRHSGPGVEIKAVRLNAASAAEPEYEVVVSPTSPQSGWHRLLAVLPKVLQAVAGGGAQGGRRGSLLGDIERMSLMHGEVIDGLGEWRHGIPVKIK